MLTDDNRRKNVLPPLDLTRILRPYHKKEWQKKIPGKIGATDTTWNKLRNLIGQKQQNTFQ